MTFRLLCRVFSPFAFSATIFCQNLANTAPYQVIDTRAGRDTPCGGCSIYTFAAGTDIPLSTYSDSALATPNTNPVLTNSTGNPVNGTATAGIWMGSTCFKFVLKDPNAVTIRTQDYVCNQALVLRALMADPAIETVQNAGVIFPQSFGAKCDGLTDDGPAFQAAIAAANSGDTILVSSSGSKGCLIATGFTISKRLALTSGAPSYPTAQLLAGGDGITMIRVSDIGGVKFNNLAFNANGRNTVTAVELSNATNTSFDGDMWNGLFSNATISVNSYFTSYKDTRVHGALQGFLLGPQSNSTILTNASFYLASPGSAIFAHNSQVLTVLGGTFECGSQITVFNFYGVTIHGNYFENPNSCKPMSQYIALGSNPGAAPVYGADIAGNLFNSGADYGIRVGPSQGVEIAGNSFETEVYAIAVDTTGQANLNRDIHLGPNSYNIKNLGYDESKIVTYVGGYANTLASNLTTLQFSPILFPAVMRPPQNGHVPSRDAAIYWNATDGALHMLYNNGASYIRNFLLSGLESIGTTYIDGQATIRPAGLVSTDAAISIFRNNHDVNIGEESSTGGTLASGSDPYAAVISTRDNYPVEIGVGGVIRIKVTANSGAPNTVVCWKTDGKTLGHATVAEISTGICH